MSEKWTPPLQLDTRSGHCRLTLVGVTYGNGPTLQDAGNDLLTRLFDLAQGMRRSSFNTEPRVAEFLWDISELIANGGDVRSRVLG